MMANDKTYSGSGCLKSESYRVRLSLPCLVATTLVAIAIPYQLASPYGGNVGTNTTASMAHLSTTSSGPRHGHAGDPKGQLEVSPEEINAISDVRLVAIDHDTRVPTPRLQEAEAAPTARYTKHCVGDPFQTVECSHSFASFHRVDAQHLGLGNFSFWNLDRHERQQDENYTLNGYRREPAGQHLLIDIANVDAAFLSDANLLANAMTQLTTQSKLTLLPYQCFHLQPSMGVSCFGVLSQGQVSLRTWPQQGLIAFGTFVICFAGQ